MVRNFKSSDEGMEVYTADGDMVGTIEEASGSTAHIKPASDLSRSVRRRLGWTEEDHDTYELKTSRVETMDDEGIHLRKF